MPTGISDLEMTALARIAACNFKFSIVSPPFVISVPQGEKDVNLTHPTTTIRKGECCMQKETILIEPLVISREGFPISIPEIPQEVKNALWEIVVRGYAQRHQDALRCVNMPAQEGA